MKAFSQFLVRVIKYKMDLLEYIDKYIKLEEKKHFFSGSILPNWSEIEIGISKYFLCYCWQSGLRRYLGWVLKFQFDVKRKL